jgi:hypothetical protein
MKTIKVSREAMHHIAGAHDRATHAALDNEIAEVRRRIAAATAVPGEKVLIEVE